MNKAKAETQFRASGLGSQHGPETAICNNLRCFRGALKQRGTDPWTVSAAWRSPEVCILRHGITRLCLLNMVSAGCGVWQKKHPWAFARAGRRAETGTHACTRVHRRCPRRQQWSTEGRQACFYSSHSFTANLASCPLTFHMFSTAAKAQSRWKVWSMTQKHLPRFPFHLITGFTWAHVGGKRGGPEAWRGYGSSQLIWWDPTSDPIKTRHSVTSRAIFTAADPTYPDDWSRELAAPCSFPCMLRSVKRPSFT